MSTEQTRALTEQISQARAAADAEAIAPLLTDDVVLEPSASLKVPGRLSLRAQGREDVARGLAGTPIYSIADAATVKREVQQTLVDGDTSMVRIHMTADLLRGGRYDNHYVWLYLWRDGRICRVEEYPDTMRYVQMGFASRAGA